MRSSLSCGDVQQCAVTPELSKRSYGANSHHEDAASQSFAELLRQDRQYRAFRRHFSLLERCPNISSIVNYFVCQYGLEMPQYPMFACREQRRCR